MSYEAQHAGALAQVAKKGAAVTFTLTTPGVYDAATGVWTTPTETTVTGSAIQTGGNPDVYRDLSLVEAKAPTIFFVPNTYGDIPDLGYTVEWSSITYTVKQVQPLRPDGTVIAARVVIGE